MPSGDSFLPRIYSVFYAEFHDKHGPYIVDQVPEGLIATASPLSGSASVPPVPSTPSTEGPLPTSTPQTPVMSRNSSTSLVSPTDLRANSRHVYSPFKPSYSSTRTLFNFEEVSKYVIPHDELSGRLVTCATKHFRVIGHPVALESQEYDRNLFRYNICFVFERSADISCYEPIVRKVSRVLMSCERESKFLSSSNSSVVIHPILEQLYEDLNSYSETSIPIDKFNSIELKIFPFYPNLSAVEDWMVPVALINLQRRVQENWDLTMVKIYEFINGVNHVSRIAHLADCDVNLTRQAITHLLFYQVIMITDIFQFSNMYTLRRSIQWLANEAHIKEECGSYVAISQSEIQDWPRLLHLYSRFKSGKTVAEWMREYEVEKLKIDPRRFTSFGVIKGFLRRVHRWPVLLPRKVPEEPMTPLSPASENLARNLPELPSGLESSPPLTGGLFSPMISTQTPQSVRAIFRGRSNSSATVMSSLSPALGTASPPLTPTLTGTTPSLPGSYRARHVSAAEKVLEQLRNRDKQRASDVETARRSATLGGHTSPEDLTSVALSGSASLRTRIQSLNATTPSSVNILRASMAAASAPKRTADAKTSWPPELKTLLDGEHHTDELSVKFEVSWPQLEQWLMEIGNEDDVGGVSIIYR